MSTTPTLRLAPRPASPQRRAQRGLRPAMLRPAARLLRTWRVHRCRQDAQELILAELLCVRGEGRRDGDLPVHQLHRHVEGGPGWRHGGVCDLRHDENVCRISDLAGAGVACDARCCCSTRKGHRAAHPPLAHAMGEGAPTRAERACARTLARSARASLASSLATSLLSPRHVRSSRRFRRWDISRPKRTSGRRAITGIDQVLAALQLAFA